MKTNYWKVTIWTAHGSAWERSFKFKPTIENILAVLYSEWNQSEFDSQLCLDLRMFCTIADHVQVEFFNDSGSRLTVRIEGTFVGNIRMTKEEMYTA